MRLIDILPFLSLTLFAVLFISLPFFKRLDEPPSALGSRINTLDGLRGFLAFSVVINHLDVKLSFLKYDKADTLFLFNGMLGAVGVSLFFMITGYLFWGKLLKSEGKTSWVSLYINRIFRIAPVYYLAVFVAFTVMLFATNFELHDSVKNVAYTSFKWMLLGIHRVPDVNGFPIKYMLGVTWTLRLEWFFYFSLIITSFFIRKKIPLIFTVVGLIVSLVYVEITQPVIPSWALFFCGMLCATLKYKGYVKVTDSKLYSLIALCSLVSIFVFFVNISGAIQVLLLLVFFYLVCNGTDLFGLLLFKGAQRFGHVSYSMYLLHNIVLYLLYDLAFVRDFSKQSDMHFWEVGLFATVLIVIISSLCYLYVEKSGISKGRDVTKRLKQYKIFNF